MLLIFIQPTLNHIGLATFLGALLLFIVPPASTVFIYLLAALSLLLGMCLAWAWGLLTMKAAFAARSDSETQQKVAALQQQAAAIANQTGQTPAWEAQVLVHDGFMLDARVTAVFYVFGCVFIYAICRLRCANPKLILMQIFGMIVTDLVMEIGPTLPSYNASLPSVLVKPGAVGIALGTSCCLLIFPQSTSFVTLGLLEKLTRMSNKAIDVTRRRLVDHDIPVTELKATRAGLIDLFKAAQPAMAVLPLDFSRGRWNAEDLQGLQDRIRDVMFASLELIDFHIARVNAAEMLKERSKPQSDDEDGPKSTQDGEQVGQRHRQEATKLLLALQRPEHQSIRSQTTQTIRESTADVLHIGSDAIDLAANYIHTVNSCRWIQKPSPARFDELTSQLRETLIKLRVARDESITNTTKGVLEAHAELFDKNGWLKAQEGMDHPFLPSLVVAMVVEERIVGMTNAIEKLLDYILQLSEVRTTHRIWFPTRLQYAVSWLLNGRVAVPVSGTPNDVDPDVAMDPEAFDEQTKEARRRLEISRGRKGSSARTNRFSRAIIASYTWLTNPAGMYALRVVIVTIAVSIPASIPSSAGFFYQEKGIWAVISAQTVLLVYMADFTFSLVTRTLGTIFGGVMGMVAWYIGAGHGSGNPYGMAAITGVMIVPLLWWRLYLPASFGLAVIMAAATFALVVGYSWDSDHIIQYGLPGKGYEAFWKRVVTVLIGFAAAFIVQILPKPPSATHHASKTLANSVRSLSDHYALLVSHWGRPEQNKALTAVSGQITLEVAEVLLSLDSAIALLKMELSFGPFNLKVLKQTQEQCQYMNQALGGLLKLASTLPKELQERLAQTSGIKDERGIGDIMAVLGIIEQALRTGSPLPERLPAPLVRRAYEKYLNLGDGSMMTTALVKDENHRRYCVAVTLYLKFLTSIDDLLLVLKGALGERHIVYNWEEV